jgi:hypothetical protein
LVADHVHRRHGEPGAVGHDAHLAVQLDILDAQVLAARLQPAQAFRASGRGQLFAPLHRRIVQHQLAIERHDPAVPGDRQGIDLEQFGVVFLVDAREIDQQLGDRLRLGLWQQIGHQGARLLGGKAAANIERQAAHGVRRLACHFFDIHAPHGREQHQRAAAPGVVEDRGVVFLRDLGAALDQQPLDPMAADLHAENSGRRGLGFRRTVGRTHAARLAPLAGWRLGLDDDWAQVPRHLGRRLGGGDEPALGNPDPGRGQERFCRLLFEIHDALPLYRPYFAQ